MNACLLLPNRRLLLPCPPLLKPRLPAAARPPQPPLPGLCNRRPVCPVCKADARVSSSDADVEAGGGSGSAAQPSETFLLRLGASWFAVRRHLRRGGGRAGGGAGGRGGRHGQQREGAAGAAAEGGGGEGAGARQPLLPGSRPSTPIPTGSAPQHLETETAATLANFPHSHKCPEKQTFQRRGSVASALK